MKRTLLYLLSAILISAPAFADLTHLVEYWDFEAAAGSDQTGLNSGYVLTHHGSTTQETTHKGGSFSAGFGASVYFSIADSIFTGTNTFSGASWLRTSGALPDSDLFWSKWGLSKNMWTLVASGNKWKLTPRAPDNNSNGTSADSTVSWTGGTWHLVCWGYDSDTATIWISVDAETPAEVSCPGFAAGPETLESALAGGTAITGFLDDTAYFTNHIDLGDIQHLYTNDMATVLGFSTPAVSNQTWYVWPGGDNTYATNWATAKTNFYPLADLSIIPGDTIEVSGGIYVPYVDTNTWIVQSYTFPFGTNGASIIVKHSRESGHNGVADIRVPLGKTPYVYFDGAISDGVESRFYHSDNHYRNVASTEAVSDVRTNCGFFLNGLDMTNTVPLTFAGFPSGQAPVGYVDLTTLYSNGMKWCLVAGSSGPYSLIKFFDPCSASGNVTNGAGTEIELCYFTNITQWAISIPCNIEAFGNIQIHHCAYEYGRNLSTAGLFSGSFGVDIWSCVLNKWPMAAGGENEPLQMLHWWRAFNNQIYPGGQAMIQCYWDSGSNFNHIYFYGNSLLQHPTNWPIMIEYATNYGPTTVQLNTEAQNVGACRSNIICEDWRWFHNTALTDPTNGASSIISIRNKSWVRQDCFPDVTNLTLRFPAGGALLLNNIVHGSSNLAYISVYNDFPDFNNPPSMACTNGCGPGYFMGIAYQTNGMVVDYNIFSRIAYSSNDTLHDFSFSAFTNYSKYTHSRTNMPEFRSLNTTNLQIEPTSGATGGLNLSAFATNMPGLLWDQNGVARGSVNTDNSWSIGALEPQVVVSEGMVMHLTFNDEWGSTNIITDFASGLMNAYQYGITNSTTNCWPTRVANTNRTGFGYAAEFGVLPGVSLPYYTNDLDGYVVGQYAGVPNTHALSNVTEMSVSVWARYYAASNNNVANDFNSTLLDGGYAVSGSWVLARHYDIRTSFLIRTNAGLVEGGPEITFPDDTSTGDTTNLNHYVTTVDIANHVFINYFNGSACVTGSLPANITSVTISADQPPHWLGLGAWTHSGTPPIDLDLTSGGDKYPNNAWFHGLMDEVRLYNRVITPAEVTAIYTGTNSTSPPSESGPVAPAPRFLRFRRS